MRTRAVGPPEQSRC